MQPVVAPSPDAGAWAVEPLKPLWPLTGLSRDHAQAVGRPAEPHDHSVDLLGCRPARVLSSRTLLRSKRDPRGSRPFGLAAAGSSSISNDRRQTYGGGRDPPVGEGRSR